MTPVSQDQYQQVGLVSAIVGFFILAYFFMYLSTYLVTKVPSKYSRDLLHSKW